MWLVSFFFTWSPSLLSCTLSIKSPAFIFLATWTTSTFKRFNREFLSLAVFSHAGVTFLLFHRSTMLIRVLGCTNLHKARTMWNMFRTTRSASLSGVVFADLMSFDPTNIRIRRACLAFLHNMSNSWVFCAVPAPARAKYRPWQKWLSLRRESPKMHKMIGQFPCQNDYGSHLPDNSSPCWRVRFKQWSGFVIVQWRATIPPRWRTLNLMTSHANGL